MADAQLRASFTGVDPFSVAKAQTASAAMVTQITEETRQAIRDVITKSISEGVTPKDTAKVLRDIVGLTEKQAVAVLNLRLRLEAKGVAPDKVAKEQQKYADKLLRFRAETIARTEIMKAQNAGQRAAWDDAVAKGHIGAQSQKVWIVAPDDRLCPNCEPLGGETVALDAVFSGGVSEPPLHPRCRCTVGLVPAKVRTTSAVQNQRVSGPVEVGTRKVQELRSAQAAAQRSAAKKTAQEAAFKQAAANAQTKAAAQIAKAQADMLAADAAAIAQAQAKALAEWNAMQAELAAQKAATQASIQAAADAFKTKEAAKVAALQAEKVAARNAMLEQTRSVGTRPWFEDMLSRGKVGEQLGSNPGGMYQDARGVKYYVKQYRDKRQAMSEVVSNRIYRDLKLGGPASHVVQTSDGQFYFASQIVDNKGTIGKIGLTKKTANKILDGFAADVLTVNWDAVGTGLDNVVVAGTKVVRIDQGGTLLFRAQGGAKPSTVFSNIDEWTSLKTNNSYYRQVFEKAGLNHADDLGATAIKQIDAIEALKNKAGSWEKFVKKALVKSANVDREFVKETARLLEARTNLLLQKRAMLQSIGSAPVPVPRTVGSWPIDDTTPRFIGKTFPQTMEKRLNEALPKLSADVRAEIRLYTGPGSHDTNSRLWQDPLNMKRREKELQRVLENSKAAPPPELVWRGVRRSTVGDVRTGGLIELNRLKPGDMIQLNGFQSTSIDPEFASQWGRNLPMLEIKPARGLYVDPISANQSEMEFMLEHGARYRVVGRKTIMITPRYGGTPQPREIIQLEMF